MHHLGNSGASCPRCGVDMHLRTPHTVIADSRVILYCSASCLDAFGEASGPIEIEMPPRKLGAKILLVALLALLIVEKHYLAPVDVAGPATAAPETAAAAPEPPVAAPPTAEELAAEREAAERERQRLEELAWREKLSDDRWVHPLPGPKRRMPIRLSRVFGADRPGNRPHECQGGHCGVDIGGEVWGEPILASHDGVVVRANRDPRRSGGKYLRVGHRRNTVFTQYFHLAAIPKGLIEGSKVRAGQVIGLLGETGIVESRPHLHFTVSVRGSPKAAEQFIDPEPLIALWPVAVPVYGDVGSIAETHLVPGHPRVPARRRDRKRNTAAEPEPSSEPTASVTVDASVLESEP